MNYAAELGSGVMTYILCFIMSRVGCVLDLLDGFGLDNWIY
jgi:hypothetical protein